MSRKQIAQKIRKQVYEKYNGHCAYCGCELENGRLIDDLNKAEYEVRKLRYLHKEVSYEGFEETK
jgi:hypothetical protein